MALLETEASLKPPQISGMFQKLALAFRTKTIEFFAEEADDDASLLDSSDEIITGQRVVVIKPDPAQAPPPPDPLQTLQTLISSLFATVSSFKASYLHLQTAHAPFDADGIQAADRAAVSHLQTLQTLISSLFATVSSFKASYLHLQTAHAPFDADGIQAADRAAVSHLQRLSDIKHSYVDFRRNPNPSPESDLPLVSHLEAQVQENQSLLRTFDTVINRLQSDIDRKDGEAWVLKQQLESVETTNERLSKRLEDFDAASSSSSEFLLSVSLFESVLQDACRAAHRFTKILIDLMKEAGWDLDSAANSVHPGIEYMKRGHNRYAILSYVCLVMFGGFDSERFGLGGDAISSDLNSSFNSRRKRFLRQFVEHGYVDPMELLNRYPDCDFARFCDIKYQELIHPNMETSLFGDFNEKELVLDSWRSSTAFYESFVGMASAVWMIHKLAFSFDPKVGIFQVGRGIDFSMVFMESVVRRGVNSGSGCKTKAKVGFTVIPGFKVGKTVIQCQVYLSGMKCAE